MRPKTLTPYVILSLILLVLIAASAYSLSRFVRLRENRRHLEQGLALEIRSILEHCRDQILRHPDYDLDRERLYLSSFAQQSPKDQLRDLGELKSFSQELAVKLLLHSAGIEPGNACWAEAVLFKTYSPNGFKDLYERVDYPRTERIAAAPPISGDPEADRRIVELALRRGYRLRRQAHEPALMSDGSHSLQEPASRSWRELQAAALKEGVRLELVSGYRSVDRQRQIFLRELGGLGDQNSGRGVTADAIAAGKLDRRIEEVLRYSSIPGFSKHHSGYTIDIADPSGGLGLTDFEKTPGFAWISEHNYLNAKRFGFIPSYPPGAVAQGPEPEPWEYVWVGREHLLLQETPTAVGDLLTRE